jgi:hypothetical protein
MIMGARQKATDLNTYQVQIKLNEKSRAEEITKGYNKIVVWHDSCMLLY